MTPNLPTVTSTACSFKSLLIRKGQDPSVVYQNGCYYLVQSADKDLTIRKSATIGGLCDAPSVIIFTPPPGEAYSADLWAPDLVYLHNHCYVYFTANDTPGNNAMHRMFALQADTDDPLGQWSFMGKLYNDPATDKWAIDGIVFEYNDKLYMIWSGWATDKGDFPQNLYIAEMSDPIHIESKRILISEPDQPWERSVAPIQESPTPFIHNGQLSIVYSADASWSCAYKLGLLKLDGKNPMDRAAWTKIVPVFEQAREHGVYGPGHHSLPVCSLDGMENWLFYHAKAKTRKGWGDRRIHVQPFTWYVDNTPNFGSPAPASTIFQSPQQDISGMYDDQPDSTAHRPLDNSDEEIIDAGDMLLSTLLGSYSMCAWLKLDRVDGVVTIAKQSSKLGSAFTLYYDSTRDKFGFRMSNAQGQPIVSVLSTSGPCEGEWYYVVGVCDMLRDELHLYINAVHDAVVSCNTNSQISTEDILQPEQTATDNQLPIQVQIYDNALAHKQIADLFSQFRSVASVVS